jgi:hypothetical protein
MHGEIGRSGPANKKSIAVGMIKAVWEFEVR